MKNVARSKMPESLAADAPQWQAELLRWVRAHPNARVPAALIGRYAQEDVRDALRRMYRNQCCYCEGRIKDVSYDHIEHRRPKSTFPDAAFDWDNLHLACQKCNIEKGNKWRASAPILDAVVDRPLEDHLTYRVGELGVLRWPKSERGSTTVEHTNLNRDGWDGLPGTRGKIFFEAWRLISDLRLKPGAPEAVVVRHELEEKKKLQYGSVIAFALEQAGL